MEGIRGAYVGDPKGELDRHGVEMIDIEQSWREFNTLLRQGKGYSYYVPHVIFIYI
jgi:hypothetical protein